MFAHQSASTRTLIFAAATCAAANLAAPQAAAEALILVEVDGGKVLYAENATQPWYPASITKIMTAYVTLRAIKEHRITLDKLLTVSHNAAAQSPVKMGFPPGTAVTVDNALKMMVVKSANDMAVVLAEGVAGSVENFADQMTRHAQRLGMTQSHFVNPNGLPADNQITSARDMAILTRAVIKEFPEYDHYWHIPGIQMGKKIQRNYNTLIGRYPGADGMKTGFICASGFNLVATATRDGRRLIAIVLGASSSAGRAIKAAQLLERGFTADPLSWLSPAFGTVETLAPINAEPPNLREEMCGKHRKQQATEDEDDSAAIASLSSGAGYSVFLSALRAPNGKQNPLQPDASLGKPVLVHTGPAKKQADARSVESKGGKAKRAKSASMIAATGNAPRVGATRAARASNPPTALAGSAEGSPDAVPIPRARPKAARSFIARSTSRPSAAKKDAAKK